MRYRFAIALIVTAHVSCLPALAIEPAAVRVASGVWLVPGAFTKGSQPDGNSILLEGPSGIIIIDTGRHATHTQAVIDTVRRLNKPAVAIINTHWHLDHIGGNALLRQAFPGIRVFATSAFQEAREGFLKRYHAQLEEVIAKTPDADKQAPLRTELQLIDNADALAPDEIIGTSQERMIGGRRLRLVVQKNAVTAADIWLIDEKTKTLIAGDLVTLPVPFLDTACPENWRGALDQIKSTRFTALIPGHGPLMTRHEFETYRSAYDNLIDCASSKKSMEACAAGWLSDAGPLLRGEDTDFVKSLLGYYIDRVLRGSASPCPPRTSS